MAENKWRVLRDYLIYERSLSDPQPAVQSTQSMESMESMESMHHQVDMLRTRRMRRLRLEHPVIIGHL